MAARKRTAQIIRPELPPQPHELEVFKSAQDAQVDKCEVAQPVTGSANEQANDQTNDDVISHKPVSSPPAEAPAKNSSTMSRAAVLERFRAKWNQIRVKKTQQHKTAETRSASIGTKKALISRGRRQLVLMGIAIVLAIVAVSYGGYYAVVGRFIVTTDDAYVRANNTTIGARVSGHIANISAKDNTPVHAGDLLIKIDDGDYRIAVDSARAKIATQEATIARIGRQADTQLSAVDQAKAQLESMQAAVKRAQSDFDRQQQLSSKGFASRATFEVSQATRDQSVASVQSAQAALAAAERNIDVIKAQQVEAQRQLDELKAALVKAERDLNFTEVRAPVDGVFSNRLVNEGDYIQPGQRLSNLVPLDDVFIDANFKETQLARLKPGQPVSLTVDGVSGRKIAGTIESISPAAGAVFTLLPPDNATGNFTKIVQRVPVRIRVPASVAKENLLRAGMSVEVHVDTR